MTLIQMSVRLSNRRLARDDRGASLVEYALLAALIAVVCIVVVIFFGDSVSESFDSSGRSLHAN